MDESWSERWHSKETEAYTIVNMHRQLPEAAGWFSVYYRNYTRRNMLTVSARDELDAFMQATKRLRVSKAKTDNRLANHNREVED